MAAVGAGAGTLAIAARIGGVGQLTRGLGQINAQMAGTAQSAGALGLALNKATGNFQAFQAGAQLIQTSLNSVQFAANAVLTPVRAVGSALEAVVSVAGVASSQVAGALGEIAVAAGSLGTVGVAGIGAFFGALAAGVGTAIGLAARFQQELVDLGAVARVPAGSLGEIEEVVKRMAQQFSLAIPDIQRVALELIKAGVAPDNLANGVLKVTLALQQLSKGELSAEQAGEGLGSLLQIFQLQFRDSGQSIEDFALRVGNAVITVANNTRASIQEVINGVNILAPTLTARGQDIESVFAALNVILSQGLRGEVGGTGLRNLFNFLVAPSNEALQVIKQLGLEEIAPFDVNGNIRPALDVLRSIRDVFSDEGLAERGLNNAQAEQALATIFQTRAATVAAIIRNVGPEKIEEFFQAFRETNLIAQANQQLDSLIRQLGLLRNNLELAAISFGQTFLDGLTRAAQGINDFLKERVVPGGAAAGAGLLSLFTGTGQNEAFAGITQQFGEGPGQFFADVFNQVAALRQPIGDLLGDINQLGQTLLGVVFPKDPGEAVARLGGIFQQGVALADRFVNFLNGNIPVLAGNLGSLAQEGQQFLDKLVGIVTQGRGLDELPAIWESLQPLISTTRQVLDEVATHGARFVRTLIDNRDPLIAMLSRVVELLGLIDRIIIGLAGNTVNFVGTFGRAASTFGQGLRDIADARAETAEQRAAREAPLRERNRARRDLTSRFRLGLGAGGIFEGGLPSVQGPPDFQGIAEFNARQEESLQNLTEEQRTSQVQVDALAQAYAGLADRQQAVIQQQQQGAPGALQPDTQAAARAAENVTSAVERANDRITEALEDAEKSQRAAFRQLERSLAGIEQRYEDTLESIAEQTEDATDKITENFARQRRDLEDAFDIRQDQQDRRDAFARDEREIRQAFERSLEDFRIQRQQEREDRNDIAQQTQEDLLRIERFNADRISRVRQEAIDRDNTRFQRGQEDRLRIFQRAQDRAAQALSRGFEDQNTSRLRDREDAENRRRLQQDLAKETDPARRRELQTRFQDETTELRRRRGFEDEDRRISRQQEEQTLQFRRSQETALIDFRRSQEDVAFDRRLQQVKDEIDFRIEQENRFINIQRVFRAIERDRRRVEDARELLQRRQILDVAEGNFQEDAQARQRQLDFQFADEELRRALGRLDREELRALGELREQQNRRLSTADRTRVRESTAAQLQANDQITASQERLRDLQNDIRRGTNRPLQDLLKIDPALSTKGAADAAARVGQVAGALAQAEAVLGASSTIARTRNEQVVTSFNSRLGELRQTADGVLDGLLTDIQTMRSITEGPEGTITIRTVLHSPQAERLAIALENLTSKIENIKPGTTIDINTVEQNFSEPTTPGAAVEGLRTVGGAV